MKTTLQLLSIIAFSVLLFTNCKTTGPISPQKYEGKQIEFGSGGGFSGAIKSFTLLDDGTLFENIAFKDSSVVLLKVEKNLSDQIFANYEILKLAELSVNEPGNTYKFLNFRDDVTEQKLVWSGNSVDKNLTLFYNILKSIKTETGTNQ